MSDRLTAMEVEKQEFARRVRGYDADDVRLYLRSVAEEIERLNLETGRLLEDNGKLRGELEELRTRERTLQQTLISAQGFSEELKDRARRESDLLVQEARLRAEQLIKQAHGQLLQIEADVTRARLERDTFESRLRGVIEQHLTLIELRHEAEGELDNVRILPRRAGSDAG